MSNNVEIIDHIDDEVILTSILDNISTYLAHEFENIDDVISNNDKVFFEINNYKFDMTLTELNEEATILDENYMTRPVSASESTAILKDILHALCVTVTCYGDIVEVVSTACHPILKDILSGDDESLSEYIDLQESDDEYMPCEVNMCFDTHNATIIGEE